MESRLLADIAEVITGSSPDKGGAGDAALFIQIKDLTQEKRALVKGIRPQSRRATPVQRGDILLAARGGQGVVTTGGDELVGAYPTLDVYLIRPDARWVDADYLMAWLAHEPVANSLQASTTGALIPRIPIASLKELLVPLPALEQQRAIGALLLFARRESVLLEQLAVHTRQLRQRQIAAAFASLESQ